MMTGVWRWRYLDSNCCGAATVRSRQADGGRFLEVVEVKEVQKTDVFRTMGEWDAE